MYKTDVDDDGDDGVDDDVDDDDADDGDDDDLDDPKRLRVEKSRGRNESWSK